MAGQLVLNGTRLTRVLVAVTAALVVASLIGQMVRHYGGYDGVLVRLFSVDSEQNIPTFFSVLLLLIASLLLGVIAAVRRLHADADWVKWTVLSLGFSLMALDEAASVHERMIRPARTLLGDGPLGFFYYAWVLPAIAMVVFLGFYFLRFLMRLPADSRAAFLLAAVLYLGGAVGIELAGGEYAESSGRDNMGYSMIVTVEEALEMIGLVVFIHALFKYMALRVGPVGVHFAVPATARESVPPAGTWAAGESGRRRPRRAGSPEEQRHAPRR